MASADRIRVFVINVEKNTFRRDHFLAQADRVGMPVAVFSAITPDTLDESLLDYDEKRARRFTGRPLMQTEKACAASHITLWQQLENDPDADYYLIMEDDAVLGDNLAEILRETDLRNIGFLKLSGKKKRPQKTVQHLSGGRECVRFAYGPLDTAAYLVSKDAVARLSNYCRQLFAPIDIMMDRSYDHGVPVFAILPYPVFADFDVDEDSPLSSDIGTRYKFAADITLAERLYVRLNRIHGSVQRNLAALQLKRD